jgi:methionyl-tRNA formyltransferase
MKIVFMGTPDFALTILKGLYAQSNIEIAAVVTKADKPKGRSHEVEFSPVKKFAISNSLMLLQPNRLKEKQFEDIMLNINSDLFVVAAYGKILPESILKTTKLAINVHASLLPKYRGAAPIHHAIINGEIVTGVTIMRMDNGIDTGDIIFQSKCDVAQDDTYGSLSSKLAILGRDSILYVINNQLMYDNLEFKKQDDSLATYAPILTKESFHIDWHKTSLEILNLIRALNPQVGAYTFCDDVMIKIWSAVNFPLYSNEECGKLIIATDKLVIKTYDGALMIKEIQVQGGKRMDIDSYLRGHKLRENVVFC